MIFKKIPGIVPEDTLFIHGNMASNIWWEPSLAILTDNSKNQNWTGSAYLAEIPGFGDQPLIPNQKKLQFEDVADWFCARIDEAKISPVHLVGHSTGGLLVAVIGSLRPDLVGSSVLLDPVGPSGLPNDGRLESLFGQMETNPALMDKVLSFAVKDAHDLDPLLWKKVLAAADRALQSVGSDMVRMLKNVEVANLLRNSKSKSLVLFGENDEVLKSSEAQRLAGLLQQGKFSWVGDCGHSMNLEKPAQFVSIMSEHLYNS